MNNMLTDKEWAYINNIIGKMYRVSSFEELGRVFLVLIRKLIPYQYALFALMQEDENVHKIDLDYCVLNDQEIDRIVEYNERYVYEDFTNHIFKHPESIAYRDTDIVNEELLINSPFYREYRKPHKQKYDGGMMIRTEKGRSACITLMRDEKFEALSDKEIYILESFMEHIEFMIDRLLEEEMRLSVSFDVFEQYGSLSKQEKDILPYIVCGCSNSVVCEEFNISESTTKKHIHSILQKLECKNKSLLINKFLVKNGVIPKRYGYYTIK